MLQRITERGREIYNVSLEPVTEGNVVRDDKFQWCLSMHRIDEHDILNRPWRAIGPTFPSRERGASWLGFQQTGAGHPQAKENREAAIDEYNSLFTTEPEGRHYIRSDKKYFPTMGRPSQGRQVRLQPMVTPELAQWLEQKRIEDGEKSVSEVVFKLLEEIRQRSMEK